MNLATRTRNFWCAAYFIRRAPHRNPSFAISALRQVAIFTTGNVRDRAASLLKEINVTDRNQRRDAE